MRPQRKSRNQLEYRLQVAVARYLATEYPGVIFRSDLGGIRLTIGQAMKVKQLQSSRSFPDIFIAEPRNGCAGLFGELKISADEVYTRSGDLRKDRHIREQYQMLCKLRECGYEADFWLGYEDARQKIDRYLGVR